MALKASDIPFRAGPDQTVTTRTFRDRGDQRYTLECQPAGIVFDVDRLHRDRDGVTGELAVRVNGQFPNARTIDGILTIGDFNFASVTTRGTRAKLLAERSDASHLDWYGMLEEFCIRILQAEREGKPAVLIGDLPDDPDPTEDRRMWYVDGFPLPRQLPSVIYGDSGSAKSLLAAWFAGRLIQQGITVLYADWEFGLEEHDRRLKQLFQPRIAMPYVRCENPLPDEVDHLARLLREHHAQFLICDSIGFAVDRPAETQEAAQRYFRALRQLRVGSLNVAHIAKIRDDQKDRQPTIFGSNFFRAGARSAWYCEAAQENDPSSIRIGVHHRKTNVGPLLPSRGYRFTFDAHRIHVEDVDVRTDEELAAGLPLIDRIRRALAKGALTRRALAEECGASESSVRSVIRRRKSEFVVVDKKIGLLQTGQTLDF